MLLRNASLPLLAVAVLAACPSDKKPERASVPVDSTLTSAAGMVGQDTTTTDLSSLQSNIPPAAPDTFRRRTAAELARDEGVSTSSRGGAASRLPEAPEALMTAVQREQAFSRFCFQEFGQKSDPSLAGNVAMVVSVGSSGISDASVGNDSWSSSAGQAVNRCLNQRAKLAWKVEPGAVKPGKYVVQLSFRGS